MRVAYFPSDLDGPAFYRCLFPAALLSANGHTCVMPKMTIIPGTQIYQMNIDTEALGELDADLFVLQQRREAQWVDGVKDLHDQNKLVICETDDADLHMPKWHPGAKGWSRSKSPMANRHWQFTIYRMADAMTVATPALAEMYQRFNPNIHVLRNYLNWEMWKSVVPVYEREFRKIEDRLVHHQVAHKRRADEKSAEALGTLAVKSAFAKGRRRETRFEIARDAADQRSGSRTAQDCIALFEQLTSCGRMAGSHYCHVRMSNHHALLTRRAPRRPRPPC